MSFAVLVGPDKDETTLLDGDEYRKLKSALQVIRSEDRESNAVLSALRAFTGHSFEGSTPLATFFSYLMSDLADAMDEIQGILVQGDEEPIFMRDDKGTEHAAALKAFLKILEADSWLTDFFIPVRIEQYAEETPTPLRVMQDLAEPAMIFESDVAEAKRMIREWPELVGSVPPPTGTPRGKRSKAHVDDEASENAHAFASKGGA